MGILKQAVASVKTKAIDLGGVLDQNSVIGWRAIGGSSSYGYYKSNQYENGYSSINTLANGFLMIEPYALNKQGERVESNILDRIYTPNQQMSAADFREALMVMTLVHDEVKLKVHHRTDSITVDTITGFTFMEGYHQTIVGGKRLYKLMNGEQLTDDEVITLKDINPDNINSGFSASRAAHRWTTIDDYIADYQAGFFRNGAVPAGEMIITARTTGEFNDIVDNLQAKHKGAGNNNNITYSHRPTDQNGSPLNSQVEWVPFSSQNKDMALKDLFDNANKKIDSVYGVPSEIRGFLSNSNYASVGVAEKVFVKYALAPRTLKIWNKFTHELTRITNGMGISLSYELEIPKIADEEKVREEAGEIRDRRFTTLVGQGYKPDKVELYLETGDLADLGEATVKQDNPEVTTPEEINDTPEQPIDGYAKAITKQLAEIDREVYVRELSRIVKAQMGRQVAKAIEQIDDVLKSKAIGDNNSQEDKRFTDEMLSLLLPLMRIYGARTVNEGVALIYEAGLSTEGIQPFEFTNSQKVDYQNYLQKVGTGYSDQTAEEIRNILNRGILDGATRAEIEAELKTRILGAENEYRVARLARTEINLSEGKASVSAMQNIQRDTGYKIYKIWNVSSTDPCEFCLKLASEKVLVDENFVDLGDEIHGINGGIYHNDFKAADTAEAHPNCNCYTTYRVEEK